MEGSIKDLSQYRFSCAKEFGGIKSIDTGWPV